MKWKQLAMAMLACAGLVSGAEQGEPGLAVTFTSGTTKITELAPEVGLFVEAGKSPSPFVSGGPFTATWEGNISAELRSDFRFQAAFNGTFSLQINGSTVLEGSSTGGGLPLSKAVQLNKGANVLKATFTSPAAGDAFVRLGWTEKGTNTSPIPHPVLTHLTSADLEQGLKLHKGRELFLEHRCVQCHATDLKAANIPELTMDAPSFEGIGSRRNFAWMSRWIADPKAMRAKPRMPKVLHGEKAPAKAAAMAAYLSSLKETGVATASVTPAPKPTPETAEPAAGENPAEQKPLFERLHCTGCHNVPDNKEPDATKISLQHVAEKFPEGKLAEFLRKPEMHYASIRMPNFRLSDAEAKELADYLNASATKPKDGSAPVIKSIMEQGKSLVQSSGCLNCHSLKLENQAPKQTLTALFASVKQDRNKVVAGDCLGNKPQADYGFSAEDKSALSVFLANGPGSLSRHVPSEFAERQTRMLQCTACHGQVEGFPPLEILGAKLRPEWAGQFIDGEIGYKPRAVKHPKGEPWLEMRMPGFHSRGALLAAGLAAQHGYGPKTPPLPAADPALAKIGQKLVGADGGFSCIICHAVGKQAAQGVFESEGINLAYSAERLLPEYARRWFRSPQAIDPQTKMPSYFEDGKSQMADVLDGDAEKQIDALWNYLLEGRKIVPPPSAAQ